MFVPLVSLVQSPMNIEENHEPNAGDLWWVRYLQWFSDDDDGVPPGCHYWLCPLDHDNPFTNKNKYVKKIGLCGFEYFDKHRKFYFGLASVFSLFTMAITIWGCFALSTNRSVVQRTYWAGGTGYNSTSGQHFSFYVGLRSLEYVNCAFEPGYHSYSPSCQRESFVYFTNACQEGPVSGACQACANNASAMWVTAFFSCAGKQTCASY